MFAAQYCSIGISLYIHVYHNFFMRTRAVRYAKISMHVHVHVVATKNPFQPLCFSTVTVVSKLGISKYFDVSPAFTAIGMSTTAVCCTGPLCLCEEHASLCHVDTTASATTNPAHIAGQTAMATCRVSVGTWRAAARPNCLEATA